MPRKPGPKKQQVLIRILEITAKKYEAKLKPSESLPGRLSAIAEASIDDKRATFTPKQYRGDR